MKYEVIFHRSICDQRNAIQTLEYYKSQGVSSFEVDVYEDLGEGLCVGHPRFVNRQTNPFPLRCMLDWIDQHSITVYFDLKYPSRWTLPSKFVKLLESFDPMKVKYISYEAPVLRRFFSGRFEVGQILDDYSTHWHGDFLILPNSENLYHTNKLKTILSCVNSREEAIAAKQKGFGRVMTDVPMQVADIFT